jgi:hypothetical protein
VAAELLAVLRLPNAREDGHTDPIEVERGGPADAGRSSGDEDGA